MSTRSVSLPSTANVRRPPFASRPATISPSLVVVVNETCGSLLLPVADPVFAPTPLFAPVYSNTDNRPPAEGASDSVATTFAVVLDGLSSVHISASPHRSPPKFSSALARKVKLSVVLKTTDETDGGGELAGFHQQDTTATRVRFVPDPTEMLRVIVPPALYAAVCTCW